MLFQQFEKLTEQKTEAPQNESLEIPIVPSAYAEIRRRGFENEIDNDPHGN